MPLLTVWLPVVATSTADPNSLSPVEIAAILSYVTGVMLLVVLNFFLQVIGNWRLFALAGEASWKSLIPIYNNFTVHKIAFGEKNKWFWLISLIFPIYTYYTLFCYLRSFGASRGKSVLGLFFPWLGCLLMAFQNPAPRHQVRPHFMENL